MWRADARLVAKSQGSVSPGGQSASPTGPGGARRQWRRTHCPQPVRLGHLGDVETDEDEGEPEAGETFTEQGIKQEEANLSRTLTPAERALLEELLAALEANKERDPKYAVVVDCLRRRGWLEQRKGRIQRIGQVHDRVQIYNMRYQDSVEDRVHELLSSRLQDIYSLFGQLPDPANPAYTSLS